MKVRFLEEVVDDSTDALAWYGSRESVVAKRFAARLRSALNQLRRFPESGPIVRDDVREILLTGFPFVIQYRIANGDVVVIGVIHTSRDPQYRAGRS